MRDVNLSQTKQIRKRTFAIRGATGRRKRPHGGPPLVTWPVRSPRWSRVGTRNSVAIRRRASVPRVIQGSWQNRMPNSRPVRAVGSGASMLLSIEMAAWRSGDNDRAIAVIAIQSYRFDCSRPNLVTLVTNGSTEPSFPPDDAQDRSRRWRGRLPPPTHYNAANGPPGATAGRRLPAARWPSSIICRAAFRKAGNSPLVSPGPFVRAQKKSPLEKRTYKSEADGTRTRNHWIDSPVL